MLYLATRGVKKTFTVKPTAHTFYTSTRPTMKGKGEGVIGLDMAVGEEREGREQVNDLFKINIKKG